MTGNRDQGRELQIESQQANRAAGLDTGRFCRQARLTPRSNGRTEVPASVPQPSSTRHPRWTPSDEIASADSPLRRNVSGGVSPKPANQASASGNPKPDAPGADSPSVFASEPHGGPNHGCWERVKSRLVKVAERLLDDLGIQLLFFAFVCAIHGLLLIFVRIIGDGDGKFYQTIHSYVMRSAFVMISLGFLINLLLPGSVEILRRAILGRLSSKSARRRHETPPGDEALR